MTDIILKNWLYSSAAADAPLALNELREQVNRLTAENEELQQHAKGMEDARDFYMDKSKALQAENEQLRVSNEKLEADAKRYQWLCENAYVGIAPHPKPHEVWCTRLPNPNGCNSFDSAIDQAIHKAETDESRHIAIVNKMGEPT